MERFAINLMCTLFICGAIGLAANKIAGAMDRQCSTPTESTQR